MRDNAINSYLKWAELVIVTAGICVSVATLLEIRQQTQVNAEQIAVLKQNSEIANKLTIFRDFYPKYAIHEVNFEVDGTLVGAKFDLTNYSDVPLALDNYVVWSFYNCGTKDAVFLGDIDPEETEKALRDESHQSIAPGDTKKNVELFVDIAENEPALRAAKVTNSNFVFTLTSFLRLENIEHFDEFVKDVGFDLSDEFRVNSETVNLPPNTKRETFHIPLRWTDGELALGNFDGCE